MTIRPLPALTAAALVLSAAACGESKGGSDPTPQPEGAPDTGDGTGGGDGTGDDAGSEPEPAPEPDPDPVCGDGVCEEGETCKEDCEEPGIICSEYFPCVDDEVTANCPNATQAELQTCVQKALQTCNTMLASGESTWLTPFLGCLQGCASSENLYKCAEESCADESATCTSGGESLTGTCLALATCANACGDDQKCRRACYVAADDKWQSLWEALGFCVTAECVDLTTGLEIPGCQQQVQMEGGACFKYLDACNKNADVVEPEPEPEPQPEPDAGEPDADAGEPDAGPDTTEPEADAAEPAADAAPDATEPEAPAPATYTADVKPILGAKCSSCHTGGGSGGHNLGTTFSDASKSSKVCAGKTIGECALIRITEGSMPLGKGCGGVVADDAANASKCITESEYAILESWAAGGFKDTAPPE